MIAQILMQFCDQKHNAWQYIVKQGHTGQDKDQDQDQKAPKPKTKTRLDTTAKFGRLTQNKGHFGVQGHSRSPIFVPIESSLG